MKCIDIIKKKILMFDNKYDNILILYYIESQSIQKIIKIGYSGWDIEQCINLNNQLIFLLRGIFNGDFDNVVDIKNREKFLKRIFSLFGYVSKLKQFKKNKKILSIYLKFLNMGLTTKDFLMYSGFIFFNKSIPVTLMTVDNVRHNEPEYLKCINFYNKQVLNFKRYNLLNNVTCIKNCNYYTIINYNVFKNSIIPFLIFLYADCFDIRNCSVKYFIQGIKLKIISCSFKFKIFFTENYMMNCLKGVSNILLSHQYENVVKCIKTEIASSNVLFNINADKVRLKKFNFDNLNKNIENI